MNHTQARELIRSAESILIATHIRPDGDAFGSSAGLGFMINQAFPDKYYHVLLEDTLWENLRHIVPEKDFSVGSYHG
ncbi:MAG: hypothetical protein PHQ23_15655, partial [Candidatus Wallbacteria bacterium]|nr:hypothetical protein [Candidatus Wallbacteria bacterium]